MDQPTKLILAVLFLVALTLVGAKSSIFEREARVDRLPAQVAKTQNVPKETKGPKLAQSSGFLELKKIKDCYQSQDCELDQSDPRAYDFAVGKKLAQALKDLGQLEKNNPELLKEARELIKSEDGFVQEAALEILKDSPNSGENLEAVISGIQETTNPLMAEISLEYFERYLGSGNEPQIHQALNQLLFGAHLVSISVSEKILKFINEKSYGFYAEKLQRMDPQTQAFRNLKSALKEFSLQKSGG